MVVIVFHNVWTITKSLAPLDNTMTIWEESRVQKSERASLLHRRSACICCVSHTSIRDCIRPPKVHFLEYWYVWLALAYKIYVVGLLYRCICWYITSLLGDPRARSARRSPRCEKSHTVHHTPDGAPTDKWRKGLTAAEGTSLHCCFMFTDSTWSRPSLRGERRASGYCWLTLQFPSFLQSFILIIGFFFFFFFCACSAIVLCDAAWRHQLVRERQSVYEYVSQCLDVKRQSNLYLLGFSLFTLIYIWLHIFG